MSTTLCAHVVQSGPHTFEAFRRAMLEAGWWWDRKQRVFWGVACPGDAPQAINPFAIVDGAAVWVTCARLHRVPTPAALGDSAE